MTKSQELRLELENKIAKAEEIINKADATTEEITAANTEIKELKARLTAVEDIENAMKKDIENEGKPMEPENLEAKEIANYFRTGEAKNVITTAGGGAAVVFKSLSKKIIGLLKDRSSAYGFFEQTTIPGVARIPVQATSGTAVWTAENTDPAATTEPTLTVIELGQNRLYKESALTQQMLNVEDLDLEAFLAQDISDATGDAVELGIFQGAGSGSNQPTGMIANVPSDNKVDLAVRGTLTFEDFKKAKAKMKKSQWGKAKWFMNSDVLLTLDLLKDSTGRPLLQPDLTAATGYTILGIPVETTDAMPSIATVGAACLAILATPDAYHVNIQKDIALYVYKDSAFTRKGLVGYAADLYLDAKPKNTQNLIGVFNKV